MTVQENKILWQPSEFERTQSHMAKFMQWLALHGLPEFSNVQDLYHWSIQDLELFWEAVWSYTQVRSSQIYRTVLSDRNMPGAKWFEGARLNYAENILQPCLNDPHRVFVVADNEAGDSTSYLGMDISRMVGITAHFLREQGVKPGDRVAGILNNTIHPLIAMLAASSVGAVWSSCSPDFGVEGIVSRFGQIEPKLVFLVEDYVYAGKIFYSQQKNQLIQNALGDQIKYISISELQRVWQGSSKPLLFEPLPFDHPLYVLYSSGTTGKPKCIVHGAGGTLLQHNKELILHTNLSKDDKFAYYTTTGWMMWNWMASALSTEAKLYLYDGSPAHPETYTLWNWANKHRLTVLGTSAKYISSCRMQSQDQTEFRLPHSLRLVLSTGSPLMGADFDWLMTRANSRLQISSISGGTDIVSCFFLGNPLKPVKRGELQGAGLGMSVRARDENGEYVIGKTGELVCTEPAPSMPVVLWNDNNFEKYKSTYFPNESKDWVHGDFVKISEDGGAVIYGRSDATLNPGGVRIGTAEIYQQVETLSEIKDSIVVAKPTDHGDEEIVLFVVLHEGNLTDDLIQEIKQRIRKACSPRHVPSKVLQVTTVPYTLSGKKVELAVARLLKGLDVPQKSALANPECLDQYKNHPGLNA